MNTPNPPTRACRFPWVSTALFCLLVSSPAVQAQYILHASAKPGAGTAPLDVSIGHLIQDGGSQQLLDAATIASGQDRVYIWRGDGKGAMTILRSYSVGLTPVALSIVDLDKNGKQDIVVANYASNTVSILMGAGNGTFTVTTLAVPVRPTGIAIGDFDRDGNPDAIVTSETLGRATILKGNGTGVLSVATSYTTVGYLPTTIAVTEFSGDGYDDAMVATKDGKVAVLVNDKAGGFTVKSIVVGSYPTDIAFGDASTKAYLGAVVTNRDSGTISILVGNGTGTFTVSASPKIGFRPRATTVADINGDGHLDILVADEGDGELNVLLNDKTGKFPITGISKAGLGTRPRAVAAADIDNDGLVDVLAVNEGDNTMSILLNDPYLANRIGGLELRNGTLSNGQFVYAGRSWDTLPGNGTFIGYHLGITEPIAGKPFLNAANSSIDLPPDKTYWCYGDTRQFNTQSIMQAVLIWGSGVRETAEFYVVCPDTSLVKFYRLSGTRKIELGRSILGVDRLSPSNFSSNGYDDQGFQITLHSTEPAKTPQDDIVVGVTMSTGSYNNFQSRNFTSSGRSWDTYPGNRTFTGYVAGFTESAVGEPLLNCHDSTVNLQANTLYYVYADSRNIPTQQIMRVDVVWASGKRESVDFLVGCSESETIAQFTRVAGSSTVEMGRVGITNIDLVGPSALVPNGVDDHLFSLIFLDKPSGAKEISRIAGISIIVGDISNGSFVTSGNGWDTNPGSTTFKGYLMGVTDPAANKPFRNCLDNRVTVLPAGRHFIYLDSRILKMRTAVQVAVEWVSGERKSAIFEVGSLSIAGDWTRSSLSNSRTINLGSTGITSTDRVDTVTMNSNGTVDYVLDLEVNPGGNYVPFGQGCIGSYGVPTLSPDLALPPTIGAPFGIYLDNLKPNSTAIMLTGVRRIDLDLTIIRAPGCHIYVDALAYIPFATGSTGNRVKWGFALPNDSVLEGLSFYNECYYVDLAANALGVVTSNGGWGLIGKK